MMPFNAKRSIHMTYFVLVALTLAIGMGSQFYVRKKLSQYSRVAVQNGMTGAQVAAMMLQYYGIHNVTIHAGGDGEDYFDPRTNSIKLSPEAFGVATVTSMATACHEVGHAIQYANGYTPMKVRSALVPVANIASNLWIIVFMIGVFMNLIGLMDVAIILYAAVVLFAVVTLPVEFDASRRAREYMVATGVARTEVSGASSVLTACALTYVAAALSSALQLLYLIGQRDN